VLGAFLGRPLRSRCCFANTPFIHVSAANHGLVLYTDRLVQRAQVAPHASRQPAGRRHDKKEKAR
jgi:hypothetical protein